MRATLAILAALLVIPAASAQSGANPRESTRLWSEMQKTDVEVRSFTKAFSQAVKAKDMPVACAASKQAAVRTDRLVSLARKHRDAMHAEQALAADKAQALDKAISTLMARSNVINEGRDISCREAAKS